MQNISAYACFLEEGHSFHNILDEIPDPKELSTASGSLEFHLISMAPLPRSLSFPQSLQSRPQDTSLLSMVSLSEGLPSS